MILSAGTKVYFCDHKGVHQGFIEKHNKFTLNILENDDTKKEGYQLWRISEYFLSDNPNTARELWDNYRTRYKEFKKMLESRRKLYEFSRGMTIIIQPNDNINEPYEGTVYKVNKICLDIQRLDGKFMKVDKFISIPKDEIYNRNYER